MRNEFEGESLIIFFLYFNRSCFRVAFLSVGAILVENILRITLYFDEFVHKSTGGPDSESKKNYKDLYGIWIIN